jgi:hypothetical protein
MTRAPIADADPRPSIRALLADPSVRKPLKAVLRSWQGRDPVDAAQDAGLLALALERVADERCGATFVITTWPSEPGGLNEHSH